MKDFSYNKICLAAHMLTNSEMQRACISKIFTVEICMTMTLTKYKYKGQL